MMWPTMRPQTAQSRTEPATAATNAPNADTGATEPTIAPCGCALALGIDDGLDRLRDMVAGGMGQMEASRAIWGIT